MQVLVFTQFYFSLYKQIYKFFLALALKSS